MRVYVVPNVFLYQRPLVAIILNKVYCRYEDFRISSPVVALAFFRFPSFSLFSFQRIQSRLTYPGCTMTSCGCREPRALFAPTCARARYQYGLFEYFPSGCENIVMMPWQWIPPPPMTPPRPLSATPGVADHVGLLLLGMHCLVAQWTRHLTTTPSS